MKVKDLMTRDVRSCSASDSLSRAAQLMWEGDCGTVPVVGPGGTVVGMITDRDVCMAAYTKGRPLDAIAVGEAMAGHVSTCSPEATLESAMSVMKHAQVRRVPVVDGQGRLAGILSMNDLSREARNRTRAAAGRELSLELADTMGVICEARRAVSAPALPRTPRAGEPVGTRG